MKLLKVTAILSKRFTATFVTDAYISERFNEIYSMEFYFQWTASLKILKNILFSVKGLLKHCDSNSDSVNNCINHILDIIF